MEAVDRKYIFHAFKRSRGDDVAITEQEALLFRAQDKFLPDVIRHYMELVSSRSGFDDPVYKAMELALERVERWQALNPSRVKFPDIDKDQIDFCLRPNELD